MKKLFCFSLVFALAAWSCKKETTPAPAPPIITFGSFTTSDATNGIITINFSDADGDMGLNQSDTSNQYARGTVGYYDFYMRYYCWAPTQNKYIPFYYSYGNHNPYQDSSIFTYRIPYITNNTKSKSLNGQIVVNLFQYKPGSGPYLQDTTLCDLNNLRYDIWIYDRALHKSNVITTPSFTTPY
ncbi:MAG TPA: hypothetical protein VKG26_15570 [Bacteroidia bacterium]|nr:hypothetical protein [Bacteroidia bacterium]